MANTKIKPKLKDYAFIAFLVVSAIIGIVTGFLPIILSLIHQNWFYMAMYHIIMVPIVLEVVMFFLILKIFFD